MTSADSSPFRIGTDGLSLRIRITPKGGRDAVDGLTETSEGPALKVRVRAAPEDGAANDALIKLIADTFDVPRRDVTLASGHKSRVKLLALTGDGAGLAARISKWIATIS